MKVFSSLNRSTIPISNHELPEDFEVVEIVHPSIYNWHGTKADFKIVQIAPPANLRVRAHLDRYPRAINPQVIEMGPNFSFAPQFDSSLVRFMIN